MDGEWSNPWKSTVADFNHDLLTEYAEDHTYLRPPIPDDIETLKAELQRLSLLLNFGDQSCWMKRAKILLSLQLPELAAGDAYKAMLLAQTSSSKEAISTLILAQALYMANSFLECISLLDDFNAHQQPLGHNMRRLRRFAKAAFQKEQEDVTEGRDVSPGMEHEDRSGEVEIRPYPWIKSAWLNRTPETLKAVNLRLHERSRGRCEVRPSRIGGSSDDCLGIFATTAIGRGSSLFTDRTSICAISKDLHRCDCCQAKLFLKLELECCETKAQYCCWRCQDTSRNGYHKSTCGRPLHNLSSTSKESANAMEIESAERLWVRIFATIETSLETNPHRYHHPLDLPLINSLTTKYGTVTRFSLAHDIIKPFEILKRLGIDIFTDLRFDTWVLRTIAARVNTNLGEYKVGMPDGNSHHQLLAISEMHHFFNHSCEPNIEVVRIDGHGSDLELCAKRTLREGEELFISYVDEDELVKCYEDRAELLKDWTGGSATAQNVIENELQSLMTVTVILDLTSHLVIHVTRCGELDRVGGAAVKRHSRRSTCPYFIGVVG